MLNTILGIVGWAGSLLVFASAAIRLFHPEWDRAAYYAAVAGLVLLVVYILSQWREIARSFRRRETRFSLMSIVSVVAVLAILVGANYLATKRDKQWDLTATKSFSLSDETVKVLNGLKGPVRIAVYDQPAAFQRFRDALSPYEVGSPNVTVEYVDADRQPTRVKEDAVVNYGTVVMSYEGRTERVTSDREQEITNALVKLTLGRSVKAYFVEGHGEHPSTGMERTGYSSVIEVLKRDNYTVDTLVLAQTPEVPADASVVVVAGPSTDFLPAEADALRKYLRGGGKALFMLDPEVGAAARPLPVLESLLGEWGFAMGHDVVLDVSGVGQLLGTDASVPVVTSYPPHPVTRDFTLMTAFPLAQSVSGGNQSDSQAYVQNLLQTSERSWSEADVKSLTSGANVSLDEAAGDRKGPITIGATVTEDAKDAPAPAEEASGAEAPQKPQTRIAVLGDSDFASNAVVGITGNSDLFVNINNWLTQQEDLISIRPRDPEDRRISLTAQQQRNLGLFSLLLLPGLIFASGIYTWFQRR